MVKVRPLLCKLQNYHSHSYLSVYLQDSSGKWQRTGKFSVTCTLHWIA